MFYAKRKIRVRGVQIYRRSRFAEGAPHPNPLPVKNGERGRRDHTRSDTSPSGSPNSNVFSVIETIV